MWLNFRSFLGVHIQFLNYWWDHLLVLRKGDYAQINDVTESRRCLIADSQRNGKRERKEWWYGPYNIESVLNRKCLNRKNIGITNSFSVNNSIFYKRLTLKHRDSLRKCQVNANICCITKKEKVIWREVVFTGALLQRKDDVILDSTRMYLTLRWWNPGI